MMLLDGFEALGTKWWVEIFTQNSNEKVDKLKSLVEEKISNFDLLYSRFHLGSLVSILNVRRELLVSPPDLIEMINIGENLRKKYRRCI